jgi:dTDP-4-amino-4,6-dideoxygalactose transaminase
METKKNIKFSPPDISETEIELVLKTLKSGWITTGSTTKLFEEKIARYIGVKKSVCLSSATAALELSLRFLGIGPGDEVITSAYTYSASAAVIDHVGAKIVLIDISPNSFEMDYCSLENAINENTKAIIPVDFAGIICDYEKILSIVNNKKDVFVPKNERQKSLNRICILGDAAHSFGATCNDKKSGLHADMTCFSFHAVKNLTTAEGGALVWTQNFGLQDEEIYREFMLLSLHGQSKDALSKNTIGSWEYDIVCLGYKFNMTDILASIGLAQLERYDSLLLKRRSFINVYQNNLDEKFFEMLSHSGKRSIGSGHLMIVNIKNYSEAERNDLIYELAKRGIPCNVHYKPLPLFTAYKEKGFDIRNFPNAHKRYQNEITLPLHTLLEEEDIMYVCKEINALVRAHKKP